MRFLVSLSYDGSNFYGFQRLNNERTIQDELEKALTKINKAPVEVKGAGRTDRGVHARDQKCHFDLDINITEKGLKKALNSLLPSDMFVNSCKIVDKDFHARFNVIKKTYTYFINLGEYNPIADKYVYNYCNNLNVKVMKKAAKKLIGAHSYKAFVSGERDNYNSIIYSIKFDKQDKLLKIEFIGKSFYRYMIRNLVGALILVGSKKCRINELEEMLITGENIYHYITVPSNGLYLEKVEY